MTLSISESLKERLASDQFSRKISNIKKDDFKWEDLNLGDLFEAYGKDITITVFIYGNDKITGARKMFESMDYTIDDVKEGNFYKTREIRIPIFRTTKRKIDIISQFHII